MNSTAEPKSVWTRAKLFDLILNPISAQPVFNSLSSVLTSHPGVGGVGNDHFSRAVSKYVAVVVSL